jgi:hypothetical protein
VLFAIAPGTNVRPGQQLDVFIDDKQVRP